MTTVATHTRPTQSDSPGTIRRGGRRKWTYYVLPTYSWLVILYLVIPISVMIVYSFNKVPSALPQVSFGWNGATVQWYQQWNANPGLTGSFFLSLRLGLLATAIATVLGTMIALAMVRYKFWGKSLFEQIMFMNIAAPEIVLGASLLGLFVTVNLSRGFATLLLAHVMFTIAYVAITVRARLSGFDRGLEEAAADLGANPWTTFQKVTFPLILPGILAGALMAFALSIDDFVTSNFVGGSVTPFPVWVYGATRIGVPPQVFVFGTLIFSVGLILAIASIILQKRKRTSLSRPALSA
jgi:spermidine/putrescine transport system permease protein